MFEKLKNLDMFEGHVEGEGLVVVGVEGALLDRRLLLTNPATVLHQGNFNVRI